MLHPMFVYHSPRLRFIDPPKPETPGAVPPVAPVVPPVVTPPVVTPPTDLGFPPETPWRDMTDKEQAAYWRHNSRKHEAVENSRADYDALKADSVALAELRAANATDAERALAAARAEGKTEGASTYLAAAVRGELRALTGKTNEELDAALEIVDVSKLTLADGGLDTDKITAFAKAIGMKASEPNEPPTDPVRAAFERQKNGSQYRGAGSIAALQAQRVAALSPSK